MSEWLLEITFFNFHTCMVLQKSKQQKTILSFPDNFHMIAFLYYTGFSNENPL
jgi:hypothetical protein